MRDRLKENIQILKRHNERHIPVFHITDGKKHEIDLINEIVEDVSLIVEKMENKTLVEVPCEVGQTVYMPWEYGGTKGIAFLDVIFIVFDYKKPYIKTDFDTDDNGFWELCNGGVFYFDDFGKTVFLTEEEAGKALKGK